MTPYLGMKLTGHHLCSVGYAHSYLLTSCLNIGLLIIDGLNFHLTPITENKLLVTDTVMGGHGQCQIVVWLCKTSST